MSLSILLSAFALGLVLASSPGPVQAVLLAESARGGRRRGFAAMLGANATFAALLVALAGGLAVVAPTGTAARFIRLGGGIFLLLLAADTWRGASRQQTDVARRGLAPAPRGVLAVLLNPGAWIFLGTTAAALMADALRRGGRGFAFLTAAAMTAGIAVIDGAFVLLASEGRTRLGAVGTARLAYVLAAALAVFGMRRAIQRSIELNATRKDMAELVVQEERNRFARDLHDILGHSLTVITVKAELAGRLISANPERAASEVADVEQLARAALADVRAAVAGYRELSLAGELVAARAALLAAGIKPDLPTVVDEVPEENRELFAWVIREGVTNVLRHSGARWCTIRLGARSIEVLDDGKGPTPGGGASGHGLVGLRERADLAGASLQVGTAPDGGFRLAVKVGP